MDYINSTTVIVYDSTDLFTALTGNDGIDTVYLGADIIIESPISVNTGKNKLIIDGAYPEGSTNYRTLTDRGDDTGTIRLTAKCDCWLKNLIINGRNYYGIPRVDDNAAAPDTIVNYSNVQYTGPQMTWHPGGLIRYLDCEIHIVPTLYSTSHELAEARWVEIGGNTTITHDSAVGYPVFRLYHEQPSFTILKGANVDISTGRDLFIRVTEPIAMTVQPEANFYLSTQYGITRSLSQRIRSFLVDTKASFTYIRGSSTGATASLPMQGPFTVNAGARVYMQQAYSSAGQLIRFYANANKGLFLNSPKSLVLYNNGMVFQLSEAMPFEITTQQVNDWESAADLSIAGSFEDPPLYQWHNTGWGEFDLTGSAAAAATTATSNLDNPNPALNLLQLHRTQVFSAGELPLKINPIFTNHDPITGTTDPGADILVEYTIDSVTTTLTGRAEGDGKFSFKTPDPLPLGTEVKVSVNVPFLYRWGTEKAQEPGALFIQFAPAHIRFVMPPISKLPLVLGRAVTEPVIIGDTRVISSKWELMLEIEGPMVTPSGDALPDDAVVYVPPSGGFGDMEPLESIYTVQVYVGGPNQTETTINWQKTAGLLLNVTRRLRCNEEYASYVRWLVRPLAEVPG